MKNTEEEMLRDLLTNSLKETHRNGLLQGSKAICHVVLDKANDTSKTPEERLEDIKKFCEVSLGNKNHNEK